MLTDERPMYLIHGWGVGPGVWTTLRDELGYQGEVSALSLPGYGTKAGHDEKLSGIEAAADDIAGQISKNAILVGWSLGGMIAIKLAEKRKDLINTLILLASTPCFVKKHDWPHGVDDYKLQSIATGLKLDLKNVLQTFLSETALGDPSPRNTIRILQEHLSRDIQCIDVLSDGLEILRKEDLRNSLKKLTCQTGIILGVYDHLVPPASGNAILADCPDIKLITIDNAGHAPFISQQQKTIAAIKTLINGNT